MNLNLTWSRRWRLHETAPPRRRRRGRMRVYASREGAAAVSRQCRSRAGFNFNFQSSGFGQRPRAPPRRRPPPPRQPPPLPPQVVKAQRLVGRISSLSRLRKAALNPDTGTASKHVFHAFYTAGSCEDRLDRELRFPYPLVDLDDSSRPRFPTMEVEVSCEVDVHVATATTKTRQPELQTRTLQENKCTTYTAHSTTHTT